MPPKSWGKYLVFLFLLLDLCQSTDVFCGTLTVFKQQWFAKDTLTLGARKSSDLKACLNFCCGVPDCQAVTFMGFLKDSPNPSANCVMFQCPPGNGCQTVTDPIATDGVVSVVIKRDVSSTASKDDAAVSDLLSNSTAPSNQTMADPPAANTTPKDENTPAPTVVFGDDDDGGPANPTPTLSPKLIITNGPQTDNNITQRTRGTPKTTTHTVPSTTEATTFLSNLAPVWVIGILIVITVTCAGTCLVLLSVYFCVRRSKTKMRSQPITSLKTPALHAFNPTNLHTTSTMA